MVIYKDWPPQQLPFSSKGKEWRKRHLDWAGNKTYFNDSSVRKSVLNKKINFDLLANKLHMDDLAIVLNPDNNVYEPTPEKIPHYPIILSKLNVLRGEEYKRRFDFRAVITNPNAISEIEENKKAEVTELLRNIIENTSASEEEFNAKMAELDEYSRYHWQDLREIKANALLNHYIKELSIPVLFNKGFFNAMAVGEEIYHIDIVGGEPSIELINPLKIRVLSGGYSSKIEDADIIILEDYWSKGKITDTYYDILSKADVKKLEECTKTQNSDNVQEYDERDRLINIVDTDGAFVTATSAVIDSYSLFSGTPASEYYDEFGNIRVLRLYWKSRRKIKRVKSYDPQTGEEIFNFYPETYTINPDLGEEETIFWINEAWEATQIGKDICVNMRPRIIQYNRMSNPSKCHFGIIGSIYNFNDDKPTSLVDIMKPYNYLYDVIHDRLNKAIAANWGKILQLDLALVPKGWTVERWLYYAKKNHIAVSDSFKEGNIGAATGKLAGGFANGNRSSIDAETGDYIQQHVNLLEFIKAEMSEVVGISKQREGQISNRETVGGVERATLQSSHITEWLFMIHDDVKKRVLECLLDTAKIALKGGSKKFQYILPDHSLKTIDIMGDEFAECDYGIVVDGSSNIQDLAAKLDSLAQAALQNQALSFSTIMKIYTNTSLSDIQRMIEKDESNIQQARQQESERAEETQRYIAELAAEQQDRQRALLEENNIRDNETKLAIAQLSSVNDVDDGIETPSNKEELLLKIKELDRNFELNRAKLELEKKKHADDVALRKRELSSRAKQRSTKK